MFVIRPVQPDDLPFLWDMGWEATAVDPGMRAMGREAAFAMPQIRKYLDGWGRPGDAGVVALDEGFAVGAAWYRLFTADEPGYGFVDERTPELAIAVVPSRRGRGFGDDLLRALLRRARDEGYEQVSLSVERNNPALKLYERHGFRTVREVGNTFTMVARPGDVEADS